MVGCRLRSVGHGGTTINQADSAVRPSPRLLRALALLAFAIPNPLFAALLAQWNGAHGAPGDWNLWERVAAALPTVHFGAVGEWPFIYSPAFAFLMAVVVPIGFWGLTALRVATVFLLRDPWVI